jgi:hypothetical protein
MQTPLAESASPLIAESRIPAISELPAPEAYHWELDQERLPVLRRDDPRTGGTIIPPQSGTPTVPLDSGTNETAPPLPPANPTESTPGFPPVRVAFRQPSLPPLPAPSPAPQTPVSPSLQRSASERPAPGNGASTARPAKPRSQWERLQQFNERLGRKLGKADDKIDRVARKTENVIQQAGHLQAKLQRPVEQQAELLFQGLENEAPNDPAEVIRALARGIPRNLVESFRPPDFYHHANPSQSLFEYIRDGNLSARQIDPTTNPDLLAVLAATAASQLIGAAVTQAGKGISGSRPTIAGRKTALEPVQDRQASSSGGKPPGKAKPQNQRVDPRSKQPPRPGTNLTQRIAKALGSSTTKDYKRTFFARYPALKGKVHVHHRIEQQVRTLYPGMISESQMHSIENLQGIKLNDVGSLHLRVLRREWTRFYKTHRNGSLEQILDFADDLDRRFGNKFLPPL